MLAGAGFDYAVLPMGCDEIGIAGAVQGAPIRLTDLKREIYEDVAFQNAIRNKFDHDYVVVHDPQPLPLVQFSRRLRSYA